MLQVPTTHPFAIGDDLLRPRLWATAWAAGISGRRPAASTVQTNLRHLDAFYSYCDANVFLGALDESLSYGDGGAVDLVMHITGSDFQGAVKLLKKRGL